MTEQFADVPELRDDKSSQHSTTDGEEADKLSVKDDKQPSQVQQQPREIKFEDNQLTLEAPPPTTAPDTRYVLSGQPTGWAAMAETVRAYDEEKVQDTKEDIDTLLVFAGLFSAVLTAFLLESYSTLQPQTDTQMLIVLQQIALQTSSYTMINGMINATLLQDPPPPFQASNNDIRVNVLWFASLIFSLITASFGMLVKQWLREYLAVENPSPQARLRIRRFRYPELVRWNVFEIAAVLPLLQQIALALFFLGLCYFTAAVHESVGRTSIPLVAGWAFCFSTVTILPMFFPRCPYKTTLLKHVLQSLHMRSVKLMQSITMLLVNMHMQADARTIRDYAFRWTTTVLIALDLHVSKSDEQKAVVAERADIDILVDVDALQSNDELLGTTILESLHQIQPDWVNVVYFVQRILAHRLPRAGLSTDQPTPVDSLTLTRHGRTAVVDILAHYSDTVVSQYVQSDQAITKWESSPETMAAFYILFSPSRFPLPKSGVTVLKEALQYKGADLCRILAHKCPRPEELQDDKFHLLLRGLSHTLEDLDVSISQSLTYFESMLHVRFEDARIAEVSGTFPDPSVAFTVQGDLEIWPWRSVMPQDARTYAAWFMIFTVRRALRHMHCLSLTKANALSTAGIPRIVGKSLVQSPSRLVDGMVGMWSVAYVAKIENFSHTLELWFRSAIEESLAMKDSSVALLKALVQLQPKMVMYTHTKWVAPPCGPWLLLEDPQQKLENLMDAVATLETELEEKHRSGSEAVAFTPVQVLLICYIAIQMVDLPDAIGYEDQWKELFHALTSLGHQSINKAFPPQSSSVGDRRAHVHRTFSLDSTMLLEETLGDGQDLAKSCLDRIQVEDTRAAAGYEQPDGAAPPRAPSPGATDFAYQEWLAHFRNEDSVFDDKFVEMLGRMLRSVTQAREEPDESLQYFRLRKLRGSCSTDQSALHTGSAGDTAHDLGQEDGVKFEDEGAGGNEGECELEPEPAEDS